MVRRNILCVCEHGNNRSVTMAWLLKYIPGVETLTAGLVYHSVETLKMLYEWADIIIVPEDTLIELIPEEYQKKIKLYNIGEDRYPRPFNAQLLNRARRLLEADPL